MRLSIQLLGTLLAVPAFAAPSNPVHPPPGHPLVGKWQWTRSANNCTEVYDFRATGDAPVVSGTEKTENVYTVAANPDPNGFYRMTMRVIKDYGGKDCGNDESDSTGTESTNFILFNPSQDQYLSCLEPKLEHCFGPLHRVEP